MVRPMKKPINPQIPNGHKVRVYRNLHSGMWSIMDAKTRRVIGHALNVSLWNSTFHVSEKGLKRVREIRRKQVIAWVTGEFVDFSGIRTSPWSAISVRFNPYELDFFSDVAGGKVTSASIVDLCHDSWVWAENPR